MGVYLTPAYMKPRSRVANWLLQMCLEEETRTEYIYDGPETAPILRNETRYFTKYSKLTMKKDLEGNAEQYKIYPDIRSGVLVPLERLVEIATDNKEYGKLKGKYDLYSIEGEKLVNEIYGMLRNDVRRIVAVPTQWLVWLPNKKILTRLVFIREIMGGIIIRPWGARGILLEVQELKLDRANKWDTFAMKKACLTKNRLNDSWRSLVVSEELSAELEGFETIEDYADKEEGETAEKVGDVE